jgi:hypothetical protein
VLVGPGRRLTMTETPVPVALAGAPGLRVSHMTQLAGARSGWQTASASDVLRTTGPRRASAHATRSAHL